MSEVIFLLLFLLEFFMGSMMFSYWLGKIKGKDIRQTRDGNPGGSNLGRIFGWKWGMAGIALDFLKGYVPLVFIVESGILKDWRLAVVSVAPVLGHAFSPFLKFSGGEGRRRYLRHLVGFDQVGGSRAARNDLHHLFSLEGNRQER